MYKEDSDINSITQYLKKMKEEFNYHTTFFISGYEAKKSDTPESVMNKSDKALYHAKNSGRNGIKTIN